MPTVILADYGGPESLDEVKPFLLKMFLDREILSVNFLLRAFLARVISRARSKKSKSIYDAIGGGSPVNRTVRGLCEKLNGMQGDYRFVEGFRYVKPFIRDVVKKHCGKEKILLFPLFPHYSNTTYRTIYQQGQWCEGLTMASAYYNDPEFLDMLEKQIRTRLDVFDRDRSMVLLTAHSIPQSYLEKGDPYISQVLENAKALKGRFSRRVEIAFQSRLGPVKWVGPFLKETLEQAKADGITQVIVCALGFTIDNSETVYELDIYLRKVSEKLGYEKFERVSCFNTDDDFCNFILRKAREIL